MTDEINVVEFTETFPDEAACVAFLEKARWQDGVPISPFGNGEAYRIGTRPGIYKCKQTLQNFSVRHGTIFEESRLPLKKWFFAIFLLASLKKAISSIQLAKYLGVTQKTAWLMLQRIRYAVDHKAFTIPLAGIVDFDEASSGHRAAVGKSPLDGIYRRRGEVKRETIPALRTKRVAYRELSVI
jgi:transposase-like protein